MDTCDYPEVKLADLSTIEHSYHPVILPGRTDVEALVIKFVGSYGSGSKGNGDAFYMRAVASAGLEAWQPSILIFDFRELDYLWGDVLQNVLSLGKGKANVLDPFLSGIIADIEPRDIPTGIIVSERCRKAL